MKTMTLSCAIALTFLAGTAFAEKPALLLGHAAPDTSSQSVSPGIDAFQLRRDVAPFDLPGQQVNLAFEAGSGPVTTAMTFSISVPSGAELDLSRCVSGLPSTHTGVCEIKGQEVRVAIFSLSNAPLSTGEIGTIEFVRGGGQLEVSNLSLSDASGNAIEGEVL